MNKKFRRNVCLTAGVLLLPLALSTTVTAKIASTEIGRNPSASFAVAQARTCSKQAGPFATQSTAYQRRRQAQAQGYQVSGVFPAYGTYGRGYAFNYFWYC